LKSLFTILTAALAFLGGGTNAEAKNQPVDLSHATGYATCWGCASPQVREAVRQYLLKTVGYPLINCAYRESGYNPSAISRTNDHGVFQFNYSAHHGWIDFARLDRGDVYYNVYLAKKMYADSGLAPWGYRC